MIDWAETLRVYVHYILTGNQEYIEDFCNYYQEKCRYYED